MFTGIVEHLATVVSIAKPPEKTASIHLNLGKTGKGVRPGDSVCINGVCLTATGKRGSIISFDIIQETIRVTNLGELVKGSKVNVERSLLLSDRIGGHFVTGHVDGTGKIAGQEQMADGSAKTWIESGPGLASMMVPKGPVAVDGISLTLVDVKENSFSVCLIPHTLSTTNLAYKTKGALVNIETDIVGKYVKKSMEDMSHRF